MPCRINMTEAARALGAEHGRNAATWRFDGNTTDETYRATLKGIEDGDPAVMGTEPAFATGCEVIGALGLDYDSQHSARVVEIYDAYTDAASAAYWWEVVRAGRVYLQQSGLL